MTKNIFQKVGDDCPWCESTSMEKGEYKGYEAVVCPNCNSPVFTLFESNTD